jgi:hypothetical protein
MMAEVRALGMLMLAACNEPAGLPDATTSLDAAEAVLLLDPEVLLDFGDVPTEIEAFRDATVAASGALLVVESAELIAGSSDKWRIEADPVLFSGLAPGERANIRIYFRPCPEAWSGDRIDPSYDFSLCYGKIAAGAVELNSNAGKRSLSLAGRGAEPPPVLAVDPQDSLHFRFTQAFPNVSWVWLNVTNLGYAPLQVREIEIEQGGDNWFLESCLSPCRIDVSICSFDDPACGLPALSLPVLFFPPAELYGRLILRTDDPVTPERSFTLAVSEDDCPFPSARIDPAYTLTPPNTLVPLDGYASIAGGPAVISAYRWSWVFTSTSAPALTGEDQRRVTFAPTEPGLYLIGLDVQNDCGEWTATPHLATVQVFE